MRAFFFLTLLASAAAAYACEMPVASTIHSVIVFRDRAQVERKASVNVPAGDNSVVFDSVTLNLLDESVRVTGSGNADAAIVEVKVEPEYFAESGSQEIRQLQARIDSLNEETHKLEDRTTIITVQKEFILALKNPAATASAPRLNMKDFAELMQYVGTELAQLNAEVREIEIKKSRINEKHNALAKRLQDLRSQSNKSLKRIIVRIDAKNPGTIHLNLSYVVPNASWKPLYDAHVNTASGEIALNYFGVVQQETGENWDNVRVTLSTATPTHGTEIPELAAWYLQPRPTYATGMGAAPVADRAFSTLAETDNAIMAKSETQKIAYKKMEDREMIVDDQMLSSTFTIDAAMSIPSDGKPHKAMIAAPTLKSTLEYVAVPRRTGDVFLRARAANTTAAPFLAGNVNVFVDNQFVSTTELNTVVTGDSLQLALGTNDAVKADRRLVNKMQEYNGLLTKTYKWNYDYLTTITNNAKSDITIDVMDQLPISQNEKIIVEKKSCAPDANEISDASIMTWHWHLKPGEKKEIAMKYSVEYPRDMRMNGLE